MHVVSAALPARASCGPPCFKALTLSPLQVVSVDADALLLEAFMLMRRHRVGGVPAVTPAGGDYESERTSGGGGAASGVAGRGGRRLELFANISVRDIQLLMLQPDLFDDCRYESALKAPSRYESAPCRQMCVQCLFIGMCVQFLFISLLT